MILSAFLYMLRWAVGLALLYSLYRLLLGKETFHRVNRVVLVGIMLISMMLPLVTLPFSQPAWVPTTPAVTAPVASQNRVASEAEMPLSNIASSEIQDVSRDLTATPVVKHINTSTSINWLSVLAWVWFIGVVAMLLWWLVSLASVIRIIVSSQRVETSGNEGIHLLRNPKVKVPFSWFRWVVINGKESKTEYDMILAHELTHVRCSHSVDKLLADIMVMALWWLPLSYMLRRDLMDVHEYEADNDVSKNMNDLSDYQHLIIDKACCRPTSNITNSFNQSEVKKRLAMMMRKKSGRLSRLKTLYLLPLIALAALLACNYGGRKVKSLSSRAETGIPFVAMAEMEEEVTARVTEIYGEVFGWYNSHIDVHDDSDFNTDKYLTDSFIALRNKVSDICTAFGDMFPIDWDHWVQGQDWHHMSMTINEIKVKRGNLVWVYVDIKNGSHVTPVRLEMQSVYGEWKINDFATCGPDDENYTISEQAILGIYCWNAVVRTSLQGTWDYVPTHPECYPYDPAWTDVAAHYIIRGDTILYPERCDPVSVNTYSFTVNADTLMLTAIDKGNPESPTTMQIVVRLTEDTLYSKEIIPGNDEHATYVNVDRSGRKGREDFYGASYRMQPEGYTRSTEETP